MMLRISKYIFCVLFFALLPTLAFAVTEKRNFTLVIDAGHGGHDAGAVGATSKEKNINLNVALAFGRLVEANCPDVQVVYTRRTDVFIPLQRRADIANNAKADLFISIHTNALPAGRIAYGSETYTLGMARASANLAVAKRENSVITLESDYKSKYQGFDPNKAESYVIFEFMQDKYMKQSVDLASCIQRQYVSAGRPNKGVHQAGFLVLRNTSMPSVLTELGFISTPEEEAYLNSQRGIMELSRSIYNGFLAYRRLHANGANDIPANLPTRVTDSETQMPSVVAHNVETPKSNGTVEVVPVATVPTQRVVQRSADDDSVTMKPRRREPVRNTPVVKAAEPTPKPAEPVSKPKVKKTESVAEQKAKPVTKSTADKRLDEKDKKSAAKDIAKNSSKREQSTTSSNKDKQTEKAKPKQSNAVSYRIQVGAGKNAIETNDSQFKGLSVKRVKEGAMYKYYVGQYTAYADAQTALRTTKAKLSSAYIVAFINGKAVSVAEAREKEKNSK